MYDGFSAAQVRLLGMTMDSLARLSIQYLRFRLRLDTAEARFMHAT
jgi:hypothetical protein